MEEKLSTEQNKNFFQKNINIVICSIFCTALWGSAFPCVKLGYDPKSDNNTESISFR